MAISRISLDLIPISIATVSVGNPSDPFEDKLAAISGTKFQGIELGFPDLVSFASKIHKKEIEEDDYDRLCSAGSEIAALCKRYNLEIIMLQPFSNFEGWERGSKERSEAFSRAKGWIRIMQAVGTTMLQLGSTDSNNVSRSLEVLASDIRELADLLAPHSFRLAYENWCWATVSPTWARAWAIVQRVDRPNVGLCLDTFQTCGGEYGDPTTASGLIEKDIHHSLEKSFTYSLYVLTKSVPKEKIYVLQISDAYKPPTPNDCPINSIRQLVQLLKMTTHREGEKLSQFEKGHEVPIHHQENPGKQYKMAGPDPINDQLPSKDGGYEPYKAAGKLKGKKALITGGDSGIGRAIAILYAMEGAELTIVYTEEEEKDAQDTMHMVKEKGRKCHILSADLRTSSACKKVIEETYHIMGTINILVLNHGTQSMKDSIDDVSE
ncbi:hypothetical protein O988_07753 [Pseudogymnoascus sp. VKM F-3808]|nr:hypothetical protein O988_07753 [Pseudogymnoascus sp. VKM F-3808]